MSALQCLGGGALKGRDLVRLVYLDESGVGDFRQEPHAVVAGVLLDGNKDLRGASEALRGIVAHYVGARAARDYVCHAKHVVAGRGCGGDPDKGREFLADILSIPGGYRMKVVWGLADRAKLIAKQPDTTGGRKKAAQTAHMHAFLRALSWAEGWMRLNARDEIGQVFAEHCDNNKQLREMFAGVKAGSIRPIKAVRIMLGGKPLHHFLDTVYFAGKGEKDIPMLQVADACAYAIRARLAGHSASEKYIARISDHMWPAPSSISWPALQPAKARRA